MKNLNLAGKITKFFLYNRPLTILVLIATVLSGAFAYIVTPKQYNPEISLPVFQVSVPFPGATADEVENLITHELEEKIAGIEGVDKIFSRSMEGGMVITNVQFEIGEDMNESKVKIYNTIFENLDLREGSIGQPLIKNINPDDVPILTIGLQSETLSQNEVRVLGLEMLNELKKVPDVANLSIHGGETRALELILDYGKMESRQVSIQDIKQALQASNLKVPAGRIEDGERVHEIEVSGTITSVEGVGNISVKPGIKLEDIATIRDGYTEKVSFVEVFEKTSLPMGDNEGENPNSRLQSQETVFLSIAKRKGANATTVVTETLDRFEELMVMPQYKSLASHTYRNEGHVAQRAINDLMMNLITSVLIVSAVLFIFLGFRSALIVAIAIPLTMALVFVGGYFFGETINRITLFALILSLGLLVDSATVVVENIYRHFRHEDDKKEAIVHAVNEVGMGLFVSTLTSVIVFLPTAQISGMMGEYMGPISLFVPLALVFALVVAYILTPFLAEIMLPAKPKSKSKKIEVFTRLSEWYGKRLENLLNSTKKRTIFLFTVFGLLLLVFSFPVFRLVHFKMLPTADKDQFFVYIDAPEGTDVPRTRKMAEFVSDVLLTHEEVTSVQSFAGESAVIDFNGLFRGANLREAPHLANLRVNLTEPDDRDMTSSVIVYDLRKKIAQTLADETQFDNQDFYSMVRKSTLKFVEDPPGPPVRATLMAKIKGPDRAILAQVAENMTGFYHQEEQVEHIDTTREAPAPRTIYQVDHDKALQTGVSAAQVSEALRGALSYYEVGQYHLEGAKEYTPILIHTSPSDQDEVQDLSQIYIQSQTGEMVPLNAVVKTEPNRNVPVRYLDEREPTVYVSAEMGDRSVVYTVIDLIPKILDYEFPEGGQLTSWDLFGFTFENDQGETYHIQWGGEWQMTLENFRDLGIAMMFAFALVYIVLVAQFGSFKIPVLIMVTIPLAFLGILPGFALLDWGFGTYLTATSLIGFIALMGIVVNNAIIYVEYFDHLRAKGQEVKTALVEAGKTRLRPILLTSITTVLGNLTIAGDPVWSGLAWSIVFGLSLSALLTLVVFPALYVSVVGE